MPLFDCLPHASESAVKPTLPKRLRLIDPAVFSTELNKWGQSGSWSPYVIIDHSADRRPHDYRAWTFRRGMIKGPVLGRELDIPQNDLTAGFPLASYKGPLLATFCARPASVAASSSCAKTPGNLHRTFS